MPRVRTSLNKNQCFTADEYMQYYTAVYNISRPNPVGNDSLQLYDKYKKIFEEYITSKVLPSLRGKRDQDLLQELVRRWSNHKTMTQWLLRFFNYLSRGLIAQKKLPSLQETSFMAFHKLVFGEMNGQVREAMISMNNQERGGEQIDQALVKSILAMYVEIGTDLMECYEQDFEEAMFKETAAFFSQKASNWIENKSYKDYMLMVNQCVKHEKDTISLPAGPKPKEDAAGH